MNWLIQTLRSSIGKKMLMALTGLVFCGFLAGHLAGNLTIFGGKAAFNSYAEHLHALGPVLTLAEWGLLAFALVHICTGLILFYQNFSARASRYAVSKWAGGRTIGSMTMPYTGILLLAFIIFHLVNFHFVDKTNTTIYQIVSRAFENPIYVFVYILAMAVAGLHVSHGLWSAFQTIGANHKKYMPFIMALSIIFSLVVGFGFGIIPIYLSFAG